MMGLHQNYPVTWGAERMEGLTLDLGLDGMFSPLPAELNPVVAKDSEPSWRFFGHSHHPQQITDDNVDSEDPCALLHRSNCSQPERKPDIFELSLGSYPAPARQQQQLINMKVEQEDVEPASITTGRVPSMPSVEDLTSQSDGSFNCWRNNNTDLPPRKELHLYGTVGDENSPVEFPDDDTMADDFPEIKPDRCSSSSVPTAVVQQQRQHPDTIILNDDDTDDEFLFEDRYTEEDDGSVSPPPCGDDSRSSQERGGSIAVSQPLPLRQIKKNVLRSSRSDEDYACLTPSSSSAGPAETTRQQYGSLKDINDTCDRNHQEQEQGKTSNSKRARGYGDHDWLPSDLLDASHSSERRNEAKRARRNDCEQHDSQAQNALPTIDVNAQVQVQIHNPVIDVNQAIQEMPQDTAEAFKELIRLVGASEARASRAVDEHWGFSLAGDVHHNDFLSPPPSATVNQPSSHAVDEMMESMHSVGNGFQHIDPPPPATTVDQSCCAVDEIESWRSVTSSDLELNSSPPLATVDQLVFAQSPCDPSQSANQSQCSPHVVYEQHVADKRRSNADVVLYEPKPEPVESWRENMLGSVVHVKQEQGLHYQNNVPSDRVSIRPVGESASAVGQCYPNKKLIDTALHTFEQVRLQIIKDPSYGQSFIDPSWQSSSTTEGSKGTSRRLRPDLKAACLMRKKGFWLNDKVRPIGEVPGVAVGDRFRYRIEMALIGLHRAVQAGIAVVPLEYSPYGETVASSVVLGVSDPYQDDNDMGDTVVYSGQGGLCGRTKESQDQELKRGNLALANSYKFKLPVRLIRGHKEQHSQSSTGSQSGHGIEYSYDGLYQIVDMNYVNGVNGKKVYKFTMHRLPGQAPIFSGLSGQAPTFSGYPAPLGSQPPSRGSSQNAMHWTESSDVKPLYLEKFQVQ